jgi:hypothetical protein
MKNTNTLATRLADWVTQREYVNIPAPAVVHQSVGRRRWHLPRWEQHRDVPSSDARRIHSTTTAA